MNRLKRLAVLIALCLVAGTLYGRTVRWVCGQDHVRPHGFDPPIRSIAIEARDYIERVRMGTGKRFDSSRLEAAIKAAEERP